MDLTQEPTPRSQRLLALAAVASSAAAAAFAFGRLFTGTAPALKLVVAALASVAAAGLFERRGLPLAILASVVLLVAAAVLFVYPETTRFGLPTLGTLRAIRWAAGQIGPEVRSQVAPTPPLGPLLLASLAATWTVAFSAHALFARAGTALLALVPPVMLFSFTDVVLRDGPRPFYAALMLAGVLSMVFADGMRRVQRWGELRPWPGFSRRRFATATTTRGARRVAVLVVGMAAFVPWMIPGFGARTPLDPTGPGAGDAPIDPFVSIQANLTRREPVELFEVVAERPAYWRLLSLDRFDGTSWTTDDVEVTNGRLVKSAAALPRPPGAGEVIPPSNVVDLHQEIRVASMDGPWLPMAYQPRSVAFAEGTALYDPDAASAAIPGGLPDGFYYRVVSQLMIPKPTELDAAADPTSLRTGGALSESDYRRYTQLPDTTRREIISLAYRLTDDQPNAYRKLIAIQNWLRTSFIYDETASPPEGEKSPLLYFLTKSRRGFCQQFASTMAAMARSLGYPSRVAVGFLPGYDIRDRVFAVTTSQAHAWPEVFFPSYGWIAFEPTPQRSNPIASVYQNPPAYQTSECSDCETSRPKGINAPPRGFRPPRRPREREARHGGLAEFGAPPQSDRRSYLPAIGLVLLALAAVALVLIPPAKLAARSFRRLRARDPRSAVLATYRTFEDRAADLGMGRYPGETPSQFAARVRATVPLSDGHFDRLTAATVRAAYSPHPPVRNDAEAAAADARTVIKDMRRATPVRRRIAGVYRLERFSYPSGPREQHPRAPE